MTINTRRLAPGPFPTPFVAVALLGAACTAGELDSDFAGSSREESASDEVAVPSAPTCADNPLLAGCSAGGDGANMGDGAADPVDNGNDVGDEQDPGVAAGLDPNGDGTYTDAQGTRVSINSSGEFVDDRGNVLLIREDGVAVPRDPEVEFETSFRVPVVTGRLIWTANPESGRVALVDGVTREVRTLPAGLRPTYLTAVPGATRDLALVINQGSLDATLFRQAEDGELELRQIPLHRGANAWAMGASGRWAVAWSDSAEAGPLDPTEGLQDVTLIDLQREPIEPMRFSVGYRPVRLTLDAEGTRVYAVTRDGISVIELGDAPRLLDDVTIVSAEEELSGEAGEPVLEDVPITPDGQFAIVRFAGAPRLKVIRLADDSSQVVVLPGEVSDVDLSGDGTRAVAAIRDLGQVVAFDPREIIDDPASYVTASFPGETLGSVALPEQGESALLFTNAIDSDRLAIWNASTPDVSRMLSLKAPIDAVFPSPEGSHAVALLDTAVGSDRAGAFSVIPIGEALPAKIQGTDAPPFRVSLAETSVGSRGLLTTRDDGRGVHAAYLIRMPSLQVDRIPLSSPATAVGLLPEHGMGYVAQQHPEGRITLINLDTGEPETLTGFELSDRVVTGDAR